MPILESFREHIRGHFFSSVALSGVFKLLLHQGLIWQPHYQLLVGTGKHVVSMIEGNRTRFSLKWQLGHRIDPLFIVSQLLRIEYHDALVRFSAEHIATIGRKASITLTKSLCRRANIRRSFLAWSKSSRSCFSCKKSLEVAVEGI